MFRGPHIPGAAPLPPDGPAGIVIMAGYVKWIT